MSLPTQLSQNLTRNVLFLLVGAGVMLIVIFKPRLSQLSCLCSSPKSEARSPSQSDQLHIIENSQIRMHSKMSNDEADIVFIRINNDFSFDDAVAKNFSCLVRSFDPSMGKGDHQHSFNVWFYNLGLSGHNHTQSGWALLTLDSITRRFNESTAIIDYLKFDIEGSEWPALENMISSGVLSRVRQMGLEIHVTRDAKSLFEYYTTLQKLEDNGWRRWYYRMNYYNLVKTPNGFRSCCYEMVYINSNFLEE